MEPAALFFSDDDSDSWHGVDALNAHSTRDKWQPGNGGLCLHTILIHLKQPRRIRVGISAVGVLGSDNGGDTWRFLNKNIRADFLPSKYPEYGQCVHKMDFHPSRPDTLFLQNHGGVYSSPDFGETWKEIGKGLPSDFGFPIGVHRHQPRTIYAVPLGQEGRYPPQGEFQVWKSSDEGGHWSRSTDGLPKPAYFSVLREAMALDDEEPGGVYLGTTSGQIFSSRDDGASWEQMASNLPRIHSVACMSA